MSRIWWETTDVEKGSERIWVYDGQVFLPYYLDGIELGWRVADYINGPAEEQVLDQMIRPGLYR